MIVFIKYCQTALVLVGFFTTAFSCYAKTPVTVLEAYNQLADSVSAISNPSRDRVNGIMSDVQNKVIGNIRKSEERTHTQLIESRKNVDQFEREMLEFVKSMQRKTAAMGKLNEENLKKRQDAEQAASGKQNKSTGGKDGANGSGLAPFSGSNYNQGGSWPFNLGLDVSDFGDSIQGIDGFGGIGQPGGVIDSSNNGQDQPGRLKNFGGNSGLTPFRGSNYNPGEKSSLDPELDSPVLSDSTQETNEFFGDGQPFRITDSSNGGFFAYRPLEPCEDICDWRVFERVENCEEKCDEMTKETLKDFEEFSAPGTLYPFHNHRVLHEEFIDPVRMVSYGYYDAGIVETPIRDGVDKYLEVRGYTREEERYDVDVMQRILEELKSSGKWTAGNYSISGHNCQHFAKLLRERYNEIEIMKLLFPKF